MEDLKEFLDTVIALLSLLFACIVIGYAFYSLFLYAASGGLG